MPQLLDLRAARLLTDLRLGPYFLQGWLLHPISHCFCNALDCPSGDSDLEILEESSSARPFLQNAMSQPPTPQQVQLNEKYEAQVKRRDQVSWWGTHLFSACTASAQPAQHLHRSSKGHAICAFKPHTAGT